VAYSRNKPELRPRLGNLNLRSHSNLNLKSQFPYLNLRSKFSIFDSFRNIRVHICDFEVRGRLVGVKLFLGQSIDIDETKKFQLKFFFCATGLGGFLALVLKSFVGVIVGVTNFLDNR